jgi:cytidylate kinase|tara:strand:+ start:475 stop:1167 length:693 start_codon:yes stop_codon:yes gene_type:complete
MSLPFNIAIDGHSSCGKSTISKVVASKYGMRYVDTGAMYRAVTLFCMENNIISNKEINLSLLFEEIDNIKINFIFNAETKLSETILNGKNVEQIIRGFKVSDNVSIVSQIRQVRDKLIALQQEIGKQGNTVMDGRDIGTKVFPNAKLKLFVTADLVIRAQRRFDELKRKGENVTFEQVLENLTLRDDNDTKRKINPLIQADDAILIDNSSLSIQKQNALIDDLIINILSK